MLSIFLWSSFPSCVCVCARGSCKGWMPKKSICLADWKTRNFACQSGNNFLTKKLIKLFVAIPPDPDIGRWSCVYFQVCLEKTSFYAFQTTTADVDAVLVVHSKLTHNKLSFHSWHTHTHILSSTYPSKRVSDAFRVLKKRKGEKKFLILICMAMTCELLFTTCTPCLDLSCQFLLLFLKNCKHFLAIFKYFEAKTFKFFSHQACHLHWL